MSVRLRCAIYTRKSSEEGLDQSFNSLDAQREACAAYILSQAGEGWTKLKEPYEDGGYSGGSMERPGLRRLLADIGAGRIDIVVVYKVDRLTRSLADFARIVEALDKAGASFVSVTQAFNTTTSMGRLTLNVLLSFAQFEREVTGERIRDKIAASKAKGMWMGGNVPLGYDARARALHVNEVEADIVRLIFRRYLEVRSVIDLRDALATEGVRSKRWVSGSGREVGGQVLGHGALFHLLKNRLYLGEIVHRGRSHLGQHEAIIDAELFATVQRKLAAGALPTAGRQARGVAAPLLGKLFDDAGNRMTRAHSAKGTVRYHYYVSVALMRGGTPGTRARVSAPLLERTLLDLVLPLLRPAWRPDEEASERAFAAVERVELGAGALRIEVTPTALASIVPESGNVVVERQGDTIHLSAPTPHLRRPINETSILGAVAPEPTINRALVRAVVMARVWASALAEGGATSLETLAKREGISPDHAGQILPLAYLAPDLVEAILDGRQPAGLNLKRLFNLPEDWAAQRALFRAAV